MRGLLAMLILVVAVQVSGCASVIHGSGQEVPMTSSPSGADIIVDGQRLCETPCSPNLERKREHVVEFFLDGYQRERLRLMRVVSGAVAGNILGGGLVGWGVDAMTGAQWRLVPEALHTTFKLIEKSEPQQSEQLRAPVEIRSRTTERLRDLSEVHARGGLTQEEHELLKDVVLAGIADGSEGATSPPDVGVVTLYDLLQQGQISDKEYHATKKATLKRIEPVGVASGPQGIPDAVPANHREEAVQTFEQNLPYFIWLTEEARVKGTEIEVAFEWVLSPTGGGPDFAARIRLQDAAGRVLSRSYFDLTEGKAKVKAPAPLRAFAEAMAGGGEIEWLDEEPSFDSDGKLFFVNRSDISEKDAAPISNVIAFEIVDPHVAVVERSDSELLALSDEVVASCRASGIADRFAITDPAVVWVNPDFGEFHEVVRIAQRPGLPPAFVQIVDETGATLDHLFVENSGITRSQSPSPAGVNLSFVNVAFAHGAAHIYLGEVAISEGHVLRSDKNDPLVFKCDKELGYVFITGTGELQRPGAETLYWSQGQPISAGKDPQNE